MKRQGVYLPGMAIFSLLLLLQCEPFPRDPEETLQSVRQGILKVGITENPPWTVLSEGPPKGIEANLVEAMARELSAKIQWTSGNEAELIEALKAHELHLVIGGLAKTTPWSNDVGLTRPYVKVAAVVGVPPGTPRPETIKDQEVAVRSGTVIADYVRRKGGIPVRVEALDQYPGPVAGTPVAGYAWELRPLGLQLTDITLHEDRKVWAVPRGENAWIMYLETFLDRHREEIHQWMLDEH